MGRADALKPNRHKGGHAPRSRAELPVDTVSLARYLIDQILVREMAEGVASVRILETEAYVVGDAAGHAYRGMTPRNRSLFLERGHAYVYLACPVYSGWRSRLTGRRRTHRTFGCRPKCRAGI
jgi:DNA-3-methyladenine glycosylase